MPSETLRGLATLAREAVAPYAKAGKVRFYQSGEEVVPGMRSRPSPGHTPGHNGIEFTSNHAGVGRFDAQPHTANA